MTFTNNSIKYTRSDGSLGRIEVGNWTISVPVDFRWINTGFGADYRGPGYNLKGQPSPGYTYTSDDPFTGILGPGLLAAGTKYATSKALAIGAEKVVAGNAVKNVALKTIESASIETPVLRGAYEAEVKGLSSIVSDMRAAGSSGEEIANIVSPLRREIGVKYKDLTPAPLLEKIYQRNLQKYGDKLGPTIDQLRKEGFSWDDIIQKALRTGGKDINFNE